MSSAQLVCRPCPSQGDDAMQEHLEPIVAELNRGLENVGLKIEKATCTFTSGSTLVRLVTAEQEMVEKAVLPGVAHREGEGQAPT